MNQVTSAGSLYRNRPFLFLTTAQGVSNIGDWLNIVALFVLVGVRLRGNPLEVSMIVLCMAVPMTFLGPFTGILADRVERKRLMILSNLFSGAIVLLFTQVTALWQVYTIILALACVEAVFSPAENGKLKEIVPNTHMRQAVGVRTVVNNGAKILGPSISGALVAAFGAEVAFYINAVTFFVAVLLLLGVPGALRHGTSADEPAPTPVKTIQSGNWIAQLRQGVLHMRSLRWLWVGTLLFTLIMFVLQLVDSQFITLLRLLPHTPVKILGMAMSASGVGMILASVLSAKIKWSHLTVLMSLGALGIGVAFAGLALAIAFHLPGAAWLFLPCGFVAGGSFGFVMVPFKSAAQEGTPAEMTGRVFGVIGSLSNGAALSGPLIGGILATIFGIVAIALLSGFLLLLTGLVVLFLKRVIESEPRDMHDTKSDTRVQGTTPQ